MTPSRKLSSPGGLPWPDGCPPERLSATARKAAEIASTILLEGLTRKIEVGFKGRINLVTEIDLASERAVIETISREFPGHGFLAEESGRTMPKEESPLRWIIDPLDGTTNYAHRYPCFCVSHPELPDGETRLPPSRVVWGGIALLIEVLVFVPDPLRFV